MIKESLYYAKILLFGEYGIIEDAMGLSIPYSQYQAQFSFEDKQSEAAVKSNGHLQKYLGYLKDLALKQELPVALNLDKFEAEVAEGMYFDSSIPQGLAWAVRGLWWRLFMTAMPK